MIFSPLPGEFIGSALKRGQEILGFKSLKNQHFTVRRTAHGQSGIKNPGYIEVPSFLEKEDLSQEALKKHTLYPIAAALGRHKLASCYTPFINWKICVLCAKYDLNKHGTIYVHTRNMLPSVQVCSKHATPLLNRCPTCQKTIKEHKNSFFEYCSGEYFSQTSAIKNSDRHLFSRFISDLLKFEGPPPHANKVDRIIWNKLTIMANESKNNNFYEKIDYEINSALNTKTRITTNNRLKFAATSELVFYVFKNSDMYLKAISDSETEEFLSQQVQDILFKNTPI